MHPTPVTLQGSAVRLEPLGLRHLADLFHAAQEEEIWYYMPMNPARSEETMRQWIYDAQAEQEAGVSVPFAIMQETSGRAVGSTRFLAIDKRNRGLEIGWTWLGSEARRTAVNTECKYLLLKHAFETLGAIRVQLKTDSRNLRSQRAIERLGAIKEGTLRNHMIMPDGYYRASVFYSILDSEWPSVKRNLTEKMRLQ